MKKILRHPFRDQAALFLFSHAGPIKSNFEKIEPLDSSQRYKRYTKGIVPLKGYLLKGYVLKIHLTRFTVLYCTENSFDQIYCSVLYWRDRQIFSA